MRLIAVVMAGGIGTRLYPASRPDNPKQLQSFGADRSLLRRTVERAAFADETYVLTRPELREAVRDHAPGATVLTEPEAKDTGPALVYAAHAVLSREPADCTLLCLPSDHHIDGAFEPTIRRAARVARETGGLVAVGVEPARPATEYGYLKPGREHRLADGTVYATVDRFVEKPDAETAASYRAAGYYWNAGMFAWTPTALLDAAKASPLAPLVDALAAGDPERGFAAVDPTSIDYAVLERAENVYVHPAEFDWDDVGSWDALGRVLPADQDGNVVLGDVLSIDTSGSVVAAGEGHQVSVVGVDNLVVVAYDGRVLVIPKRQSQRVREVIAASIEREPNQDQ